ncbi:phosphatidylserine decarboxylase proenzyme, mitochondrial-like isoform X2 [Amphiura filiformis]|uniref:phosphatidylserine decarboxylase proenzyme, mitochondrial-like isoform X2 n=1 Tax=Amphiura filiformis TaxID=82378 RepID=UPI003B22389A
MNSTSEILIVLCRRGFHGYRHPLIQKSYRCPGHRLSSSSSSSGNASWSSRFVSGLENYSRSLKWVPIPLSVGFAYICYQQYGHIKKRERRKALGVASPEDYLASQRQVNFYKYLPLRMTSRVWGKVNDVNVPTPLRGPMFRLYSWLFDCNLSEALIEDLSYYQNLGQFFRREIKPDVRPVSPHHSIVSPCDGRILHFGKVENSLLEQVKGVTYSLKTFLGPNTWNSDHHTKRSIKEIADEDYHKSLGVKPDNCLYHCVIYLAPGDYHRFHSPVNWNIQYRRHFPGCLLSVNPGIARWVRGLFSFNERVVLYGDWEHGFFSYTAVGATNVGSINLKFDQEVVTNVRGRYKEGSYQDRSYSVPTSSASSHDSTDDAQSASSGIGVNKGECIGEFNLGSTIVMVFEAPKDFQFSVAPGERVKLGEKMGTL